jgi:hypothetical protein
MTKHLSETAKNPIIKTSYNPQKIIKKLKKSKNLQKTLQNPLKT